MLSFFRSLEFVKYFSMFNLVCGNFYLVWSYDGSEFSGTLRECA
jgi:hypothetical protein